MILFEFVFVIFIINYFYFVPECLDPAEFLLVLSQRDPPTAVDATIQESVVAVDVGGCTAVPIKMENTPGVPVDVGGCTAVPIKMENTPGVPDLDSSRSPPSKRCNTANEGMFVRVCCMFCPVQSRCFIVLWLVVLIRSY